MPVPRFDGERSVVERWVGMLRSPATSFVGRERELAAISELLSDRRLVTLIGPGGVGKTRLALAVGKAVAARYPDGVCFVDLTSVTEATDLLPAIARALDIRVSGERPLLERLSEAISDRPRLLILDNFEQVITAAPIIAQLLSAAAELAMLVTSRIALRITPEQEYPVEPLPLIENDLQISPALQLFFDRAQAVQLNCRPDETTIPLARAICERLDGLPLAIELAVARLRVLTLPALLERLERRLPLLVGGPRDAPARQRTLRDTIAWSIDLLGEAECRLFQRLAIFSASWSLPAAMALEAEDEFATLDRLTALIEQSLVVMETIAGEPRYTMLETVREYAGELLVADPEAPVLYRRIEDYYVVFAEQVATEIRGADQERWLALVEAELPNLRTILARLIEQGRAEPALRISTSLARYWHNRGYAREGCTWLLGSLALLPVEHGPNTRLDRLQADAQRFAGWLLTVTGKVDEGRRLMHDSIAIYRRLNDNLGLAYAINNLGVIFSERADNAEALRCYYEALAIHQQLGPPVAHAQVLHNIAISLYDNGQYNEAVGYFHQALAMRREINDRWGIGTTISGLGGTLLALGRLHEAHQLLLEGLRIQHALHDSINLCSTLERIAELVLQLGVPQRAVYLLATADTIRRRQGTPLWTVDYPAVVATTRAARERLGPQHFIAAWDTGMQLSVGKAVELALSSLDPQAASSSNIAGLLPTETADLAPQTAATPALPGELMPGESLTRRELEVLLLLTAGLTNKEIATQLVSSVHTVNSHVKSIFGKLGVTTRTAAMRIALTHGIVVPPVRQSLPE